MDERGSGAEGVTVGGDDLAAQIEPCYLNAQVEQCYLNIGAAMDVPEHLLEVEATAILD
ncbi:hypothetical protein SLV14_000286 [Streptomyces sp. Je 1-4]|uniref:hypothetical protein n=1 Tax=Streptomyces TaxID=1883 RepID=UPI0021D8A008|nr:MULTISPECIES: hypothetical protein [unclassified Streptomyces]UYB37976.1 hypothetical protein SLV14_000286 [Streptomyces sp. Je 1-4]UZQ33906.1 hypothetical protein SLV14N_000286 [Streptomyces sp. Je 1-4] [Streptomyces sp. Je 1-4 4N24]UZQ41324.1 hypothetical protein SLV14NA_000286 [Streptomyces sp. Je 1-4] [Streptomyces sp. Je 1-4 4N24_ara]